MLLDSNIIIYSTLPQHSELRRLVRSEQPVVSIVSFIEVFGFHTIDNDEKVALEEFFQAANILPLTDPIAQRAVSLRQTRRMSLGDSIIAATALIHDLTLITHNVADFQWIDQLVVHDPLG